MAKPASKANSNGGMHTSRETERQMGITGSRKSRAKRVKSNITNKVKTRRSIEVTPEGDEGEDDNGDSSAIEDDQSPAEEPDALALSDAQPLGVAKAPQRLAGHEPEETDMFQDMSKNHTTQSTGGAECLLDASEDDDYADVENVSDSEGSEFDETSEHSILRSAEQDLIDEFERAEERCNANTMTIDMNDMALDEDAALARRLSLQASESQNDEFGFAVNMNEDPFYGFSKDGNTYQDMWGEAESALWRMPETIRDRDNSYPSATTQKRVRFEEAFLRSPGRSDSEDPNEAFPDLFAASDDPIVKQRIALGRQQDSDLQQNDFADFESFYDFEDEDEKLAFQVDEESDSDDEISSYDSEDDGDTTDEETREEQIARMQERKTATLGKEESSPSTPLPTKRALSADVRTPGTPGSVTPQDRRGPKSGTFAIDPTRATITTDPAGKRIKILPPTRPLEKDRAFWERARSASSSHDNSPRSSYLTIPSPGAESGPPRPFTAQSTLGSMFNGNLDILRNNDLVGIADDMFPTMMATSHTSFTATTVTDDSDTDRQDINMQDFIDMNDSDSDRDSDSPPNECITSPLDADMSTSFTEESDCAGRRGSGLLEHFDQYRGVIGSFRRNQHQARHVSSLASHPAKRASTHEYNALQKGRRGAANTPMTPARKKRASQDLSTPNAGVRKSFNSPLTSRLPRSRGNSLAGISNSDLYQTLTRNPFE